MNASEGAHFAAVSDPKTFKKPGHLRLDSQQLSAVVIRE